MIPVCQHELNIKIPCGKPAGFFYLAKFMRHSDSFEARCETHKGFFELYHAAYESISYEEYVIGVIMES